MKMSIIEGCVSADEMDMLVFTDTNCGTGFYGNLMKVPEKVGQCKDRVFMIMITQGNRLAGYACDTMIMSVIAFLR